MPFVTGYRRGYKPRSIYDVARYTHRFDSTSFPEHSAAELRRIRLLGTSVNKPAFVRRATLPYRSMPALESSWNQENNEYNRGGKRNHEKTKETMKAMA